MISQLSWKIGGQQGEGVESTDRIFSTALNRLGYYLYGYRHFSSRIKGGHTNNKIRISTKPIRSISDDLDILVAFDQESIDLNAHELRENAVVVADAKFNPTLPEGINARLFPVPITAIAEELGTSLFKNMAASGASWALLGLPLEVFNKAVEEEYGRKGAAVVEKNIEAVKRGAEYVLDLAGGPLEEFRLEPADGKQKLFIIGNDAIGLGAVAAGCRFMPAYPITPASEIMEYLIKVLPKYGGTVIQTEDEIAACTMAIGANYGGVRAMTASAGPGLSLMMEAIGLAGMTEIPVVIVDTQRGGPSTGLPTKQEQSDINAMIYGTHGEIPKIVIAPSTIEECFYDTVEAFNLAEEYQCPVIVLTDLQLSLGKQSSELLDYNKFSINRGKLVHELEPAEPNTMFKRYEFTEDGISPRVLPGTKYGIHHVTGVEHDQTGRPNEGTDNRKKMMDKRLRKLTNVKVTNPIHVDAPHEEPDVLIIGIGSTGGTIDEARGRLDKDGLKTNHITVRLLNPFPAEELRPYMEKAKTVVVVENNATAQLANLIKLHVGFADKIKNLLKYNGNPFLPSEIYQEVKELNVTWQH
ncbi:2-oxoglutarate synthase subunit KorA [Paenibacillus larvae subsp. larvae]|uniref:2-oxoglutarate synthase subunit KorA n=1 Tax=Paenibacillus larvae subsp. larvae TaxID=147375 RepID=A0A2L1U1J6_9BACL|nr:2-oxoacid:acceptor oxidoreductase subunit alpha [Paenibacillus larvae]AQZ48708.1 2-oxoglutarate ferredoxin oxidoreductase subunit alpha [Paenibacillus larvae subsp. pulvifaciens]AVF26796.1 2-oxoglutarate synthase subunit KorA [Paenibacillus larvae subsp. larvae]AVF31545.1 2-oxoglutarate synthase subunit KorA [Paenibacillus larvae subsp. larvae]MBH0342513.1 2-oxoglutarate ferredoxin oxidoreductase subunit alpha [Paenibacillus larvae]MCY7518438.1 2-oxoacid:acceptor oxidoreductase subunit alph